MKELKQDAEHMKGENYKICMRMMDMNEENSKLREQNMNLRFDNDNAIIDLRKVNMFFTYSPVLATLF